MDEQIRRTRGPSHAVIEAGKFFAEHPETSAAELADRFHVAEPTIYRSEFWRAAKAKQSKVAA